jgi:hypothetical protein
MMGGEVRAMKIIPSMETVGRLTMVTREDAVGNGRVDDTARGWSRQQQSQGGGMAETEGEEMTRQWTTMMTTMAMTITRTTMLTTTQQ